MTCNEGLSRHQHDQKRRREIAPHDVKCSVCGCFRRESDKVRHKYTTEHQKPGQEQEGAVECLMCGRWLRSRGGLAVCQCARQEKEDRPIDQSWKIKPQRAWQ